MQLPDQIWLLLLLLGVEVNAPVVECLGLLEDTWRPWIFILWCPYVTFVIIMSLSHHILMSLQCAANFFLLNLLWICELRFKCSMSSLDVVFFLRPFLWGILAFRIIVETVCKSLTLFYSKWENKLRYQGQLNHPTRRMTKKLLCCILPHVTISPSLKRKRICYSFILFKIVCHFSMVTSQKHHYTNKLSLHLNIHSLYCVYVAILMAREGTYHERYRNQVPYPAILLILPIRNCTAPSSVLTSGLCPWPMSPFSSPLTLLMYHLW